MSNIEVAYTILQQLGGKKFMVMTGAKNFTALSNGLSFVLPGDPGFVKNKIRVVEVILDPSDTYTISGYRMNWKKPERVLVESHSDVYCDSLQEIFTRMTGLDTHL